MDTVATAPSVRDMVGKSARSPWGAVLIATLLYVLNKVDAIILAPLGTPIKQAFALTDFQFSLLAGPVYAVFYGLCGLPMGRIVDRKSIRMVMFCGIVVWSIATGACGLATGFVGLILARIMVGAGEATLTPAAYLMISSHFPRERRTLPLSIYGSGASIGIGLGLAIGGYAAGVATKGGGLELPLIGWVSAWRVAFLGLGFAGLMLAPLAFLMPEPDRSAPAGPALAPVSSLIAHIRADRKRFAPLFLLFFTMCCCGVATLVWLPIFVTRVMGVGHAGGGSALGGMVIAGGLIGHALSGFAIDWYHRRGGTNGSVWFAVLATVISLPALILAVLLDNPLFFWPLVMVHYTLFVPWAAYGAAAMLEITPVALRGRISALFLLVCSAGGQVVGPTMVGALNNYFFRDEMKLGDSIAIVAAIAFVVIMGIALYVARRERNERSTAFC